MNNIYKVIWSKAKNCYVVASEIAKSHTKSASGSEKMGGYGKKALLALAAASAIFCGGLVNVGATVRVNGVTDGANEVYTTTEVNTELGKKANADSVYTKGETYTKDEVNTELGKKANADSVYTKGETYTKDEVNTELGKKANAGSVYTKGETYTKDEVNTELGKKANAGSVYTKGETYTKDEVNTELGKKANADSVYTKGETYTKDEVNTELGKKANADSVYTKGETYTKDEVNTELGKKANADSVYTKGETYTKDEVNTELGKKADANNVYTKTEADGTFATSDALTKAKNELDGKIDANTTKITDLQTTTAGQADAIKDLKDRTTNISYDSGKQSTSINGIEIGSKQVDMGGKDLTHVGTINGTKIGANVDGNYIHQDSSIWGNMKEVDTQVGKNAAAIAQEKTDREKAIGSLTGDKNYIKKANNVSDNLVELDKQAKTNADNIQTNANNIKNNKDEIARVNGELVKTNDYFNAELGKTNDYFNKELSKTNNHFNTELGKTNAALQATNKRTAGIDRIGAKKETTIEGNVTVDSLGNVTAQGKLKGEGVDAGAVNAGSLNVENASTLKGDVTMDNTLTVKGDTSLGKTDVGGALNVTGKSDLKDNVILGTNAANKVTVNGTANFNAAVNMDKGLTVDKGLNVNSGDTNLKNTMVDGNLKVTGTITTDKMIFGEAPNNYTEIDHGEVTSKNLVVNAAGEAISSSSTFNAKENKVGFANSVTGEQSSHKQTSDMIVDNVKNNITGDQSFHKQTSDVIMDNVKDLHNSNNRTQTKTETKDIITDKDGNSSTTSQTASENKTYLKDKDGKNTNSTIDTAKGYDKTIKGENGETSTKQDELNITNTAQNGTITNDAQNIVNNATGDMTNTVGGKLTTTVTGQATEEFNGGLNTIVTGTENHTVNGKQINTVTEGQENIISGGQTNTITGGQINNITGDQTTTITGNKTETVTENVTEDYKKNLTTTVGGNEIHEVKGTKTETVEGKLTENFKGGQETNVTGDQDIKVSGTQTTTATDIKRNASSGMIDTIDNDYGTNTETKVAGETKTEVSIKGTDEKGEYIRGATQSRDYLIKGTLKNSETKTAEATSSEVTDGTNKASTIQDAKNLAGSVTNGTETGVSGIHANDDGSVSIDSAVAGGGMSSVINQKKDSITSAVGDGTNSTVILQDKDNVTIASSNGTVGIVGKDILNNAQDTITNTAGTKITDTAGDSTVTTENGKGTTFAKTGSTAFSTEAGAPTDTNIAGNLITTGRVDANELGVSDKDGDNTADFSVKAGDGVKASAGNGTTTGSLDVTAGEVVSSVKDADGKGSTFKQRIDAIMMESKNVSIKADEKLTNEAKVITNKASEVINNEAVNINNTATGIITSKASEIKNQADKLISNKVGENTWENMEDGKITTSIKDGTKQNLTESNAAGTTQSTVDGAKSTVTIQNADGLVGAVTNGTSTNASATTATSSAQTIVSGGKANSVITTIDGTQFVNSEATAPVTGASGAGTALNTTIKGNTITTGKVTMDYADVMKDLGVRGNAKVGQNLEVGGTSTLKGDVTMGSNATVEKDLNVKGTTTTKTLTVTENATVGGTLDVTGKANFKDSVGIAKDLAVGGNATIKGDVTAKSYKVGDKTYISADGINANDQKITNVADGSISEGSKDAVNGGQLYGMKTDLEHKVDKVGANAAAMANLHPMEFDPDSKWNIAAAMGNYGSETATAIGAFYRPNEDVMVNFSTAFGTGENMVGGGVSVRLGKGSNKLSRQESNALKAQVNDLTARMDALLSVLNPNMSKDFPDVPENHWAYEAVSRLAGNDIVQGYPDGEFHGDRTMTRYEMAEIIYNALSRGAEAEKELVEEFKPELQAMAASEKATAERAEG